MNNHHNFHANGIYVLNPQTTPQQINCAIKRSLCKADAFATLLSVTDAEAIGTKIFDNCLWILSDLIHEAYLLFKTNSKTNTTE